MSVKAKFRGGDALKSHTGIDTDIGGDTAPVAEVHRSKELTVAVDSETAAVFFAPDFLQTKKVGSVGGNEFFDFVIPSGEAVNVPADKKHN